MYYDEHVRTYLDQEDQHWHVVRYRMHIGKTGRQRWIDDVQMTRDKLKQDVKNIQQAMSLDIAVRNAIVHELSVQAAARYSIELMPLIYALQDLERRWQFVTSLRL